MLRGERRKEQNDQFNEVQKKVRQNLTRAFSNVARSKDGLQVLRYLMHECGYHSRLGGVTEKGCDEKVLLWNASRRDVYLDIRRFMTPETIRVVEELDLTQEDDDAGGTRLQ